MSENLVDDTGHLEKELNRTRKELSILFDISTAMRTTLELDHILYIILTGVTAHTGLGFNRAVLFLVNKKDRVFEGTMMIGPESGEDADKIWKSIERENKKLDDLVAHYKETKKGSASAINEQIRKLRVPLNVDDGGLLASAYFQGSSIHIPKNVMTQHQQDPLFRIFKANELVIMPLKAKDKVNGIIVADNLFTQKPISSDDLKTFEMLANQAGLAIENSRLFEMVVHKSHTDSLTSLWNHGFLHDTLISEFEKASKNKSPISLLMVDIDNFKNFNDTWGHYNGDIILTVLAQLLKNSSRETDYVCRYGGEEFSIILTNTSCDQAYIIAERLRQQISNHNFLLSTSQTIRLTVSIGIATYPDHAETKEDLLLRADKAMYTAKFMGKNNTCIAEKDTNG